jgi:hypothetical protein
VLSAQAAKLFFLEIYDLSREEGWTSSEHFTADGTPIEDWASMKSFVRKDGHDQKKTDAAKDDDPGNPSVNFREEKRTNQTHQSTTDPQSVLSPTSAAITFTTSSSSRSRLWLEQVDEVRELHEARVTTVEPTKDTIRNPSSKDAGNAASRRTWPENRTKKWRAGRAHHQLCWLCHEPEAPQAGGRNLQLDENNRRIAPHALPRNRTQPSLGLLRGQRL